MLDKIGTLKRHGRRAWNFFWNSDSPWSWLANIIVAFLVIRYLVYPILGIILGTNYPIVAVVSESMEHGLHDNIVCGQQFEEFHQSFSNYWQVCGPWYEQAHISPEEFSEFPFRNGFDKGDVIVLWRATDLEIGDILVFWGTRPQPIIHRIVSISTSNGNTYYQTKGDHNSDSIQGSLGETSISQDRIIGKGILRLPYLGWIKILFVDAVRPLGITIQR